MTAVLMAVCLLVGFALGWLTKRHRLGLLAENNHWLGEDIEALKGADLDADVAAERSLRLSGEQPKVELYDQDADLGRTYSLDDVMDDLCITQAEVDAADDGLVWCVQFDARGGWCALLHNDEPTIGETELETLCGWVGTLPAGLTRTLPTCVECEAFVRDNDDEDDIDQPWLHTPCGTPITVDDDGTESCSTCGTVITETTEPMAGLNNWADAIHVEDDGPESLPRVLPEGRISD